MLCVWYLLFLLKKFSHANGNIAEEQEETDEELEDEEEIPEKPLKAEPTMNARRWKWEVLDD